MPDLPCRVGVLKYLEHFATFEVTNTHLDPARPLGQVFRHEKKLTAITVAPPDLSRKIMKKLKSDRNSPRAFRIREPRISPPLTGLPQNRATTFPGATATPSTQ